MTVVGVVAGVVAMASARASCKGSCKGVPAVISDTDLVNVQCAGRLKLKLEPVRLTVSLRRQTKAQTRVG